MFSTRSGVWRHCQIFVKTMARRQKHGTSGMWKTRPLRVLVDMDGVLCDFEGYFMARFCEKYPGHPFVPLEERKTFYLADQYSLLDPDHTERVRSIIDGPGFFRQIPVIDGAVEAVKDMSSLDNTEVFLCTSPMLRTCYSASEKLEWVKEHLGSSWLKQVILAHDKTMVQGDILIDDRPVIKGSMKKPSWEQILFTAWHNRHFNIKDLPVARRLDSWDNRQELMDILAHYRNKIA